MSRIGPPYYTLYLTVTGITLPSFKSIGQMLNEKIKIRTIHYGRNKVFYYYNYDLIIICFTGKHYWVDSGGDKGVASTCKRRSNNISHLLQ